MPRQLIAKSAAVAAGHPLGAAAGFEMLQHGGNAIDAAVAAMIALSVVIPGSVGLGGYGGSAVIYSAGKNARRAGANEEEAIQSAVVAVDFDSCAPRGFREGLVTADPESNYYGARSVTVPAVVAGLDLILREFGTKSWSDVSQPAIQLAKEGFEFDSEHKRHLDRCAAKFDRQSFASLFLNSTSPNVGDLWRQPDLARFLGRLAMEGPNAFYEGDIARSIVRYLQERGGILTEDDFRTYSPQIVEPLAIAVGNRSHERKFQMYTPPPPSGGITSAAIVQTLEQLGWNELVPWSARYFHVLSEATKLCWHERHAHLGDPEFVDVPFDQLLSENAAAVRADAIRDGQVLHRREQPDASTHTANVIAADNEGNLISLTATQGWMYGSHLAVDGMGLVLNHGMSRFDYTTGHPNAPIAGKRMQHNMAPMIILDNDRPAFAMGLPGGPKIVNVTAQLALDLIAFGATPAESIAAPRVHTVGEEPLQVSVHMPDGVVKELESMGHTIQREEDMGGPVNVLAMDSRTRKINIASGELTGAVAGI